MSITFDDRGYGDPVIPADTAAAIDPMALRLAAAEVDRIWHSMVLPTACAADVPDAAASLITVEVDAETRSLSARTSTENVTWDLPDRSVRASTMTDYLGTRRRAVRFHGIAVTASQGIPVAVVPAWTPDGGPLSFWCAELLPGLVSDVGRWALVGEARRLTERHAATDDEWTVFLPFWEQRVSTQLPEVVAANWAVDAAEQQVDGAVCDRGASDRLRESALQAAAADAVAVPQLVLGAHGPILSWFTAGESRDPFAVMLTFAESWALAD